MRGRVLAINSDVILLRGARIDGDLLVVGGEVEGSEGAVIGGELRVYHPPLRYTQEGDQLVARARGNERRGTVVASARASRPAELQPARDRERGRRTTASRGLPVRIGPVLYRDQGWGHLKLDATAVLRTESSFSGATPDVGHEVTGEARAGRQFGVSVGGRLFDVVRGVEEWQLSNAEVALASFFFHRDYRDYYGRHGGQLFAALRATEDADLTLSYGDERWRARPTRDPFAFAWNGVAWRENPQMDAGRFHLVNVTLRIDTRNDALNPWAGWYVFADFERGAGWIDVPGPTSPNVRILPGGPDAVYAADSSTCAGTTACRPSAQLNLRLAFGGWLSGDPLPLQRRLSIDGPGTVPGFDFRSTEGLDVGTCSEGTPPPGRPAQCERVALDAARVSERPAHLGRRVDAERRGALRLRLDGAWVFFADAGRGWLVNAPGSPLNIGRHDVPPLSTYRTDIGAGLSFDRFGIYLAKALSEPNEPLNVFVRVKHRF